MTDLRETVSTAILKVMREDGQFGVLAFADAAIAAMQPAIAQARREALEEAAEVAFMEAVSHLHAMDEGEPFAHLEYEATGKIHKAIRAMIEREVK